jgi:hypothetical protein
MPLGIDLAAADASRSECLDSVVPVMVRHPIADEAAMVGVVQSR